MIIVTILVFFGILLALVLVHEWGHFVAARKAGCRVEEFGFGFPPRLFSWQKGETRYSFNLLPIGGFVKIEGEDMEEESPGPRSFASKSASWRVIILAAGVFMNLVLAWVLLSWQAVVGIPTLLTDDNQAALIDHQTYISFVAADSPASQAGLTEFDRVVRISDVETPTIEDIQRIAQEQAGEEVPVLVNRQGQDVELAITPRLNPPEGEGAIGVSLLASGLSRVSVWQAPWTGLKRTYNLTTAIASEFARIVRTIFSSGKVGQALSGPVAIAVYTNEATEMGLAYVLEFAALISINLALINILPIPALDGGRILFVLLQKVFGRKSIARIETYSHTLGFVLLIALMIGITFRDVQRLFF